MLNLSSLRDIKPDNILLDVKGHAHFTDFNIAVHMHTSSSSTPGAPKFKLLTGVAGSMAYMAPEVLAKKGYTNTVDWWSLGVVAYELLFGKRPFRGRTNGELKMAILRANLRFPDDAASKCSRPGISLLRGVSFCSATDTLLAFLTNCLVAGPRYLATIRLQVQWRGSGRDQEARLVLVD